MKKVETTISYKTKIKLIGNFHNDQKEEYITYKKDISRKDCPLKPSDHDWYNSDMFPSFLKRAHSEATKNREWCLLSELPENVTVEKNGFLSTVKVKVIL